MFNIYLTNLGKYTEGFLIGQWVNLPCDDLEAVYKNIGINERYEEKFITDFETDFGFDVPEYASIEELNELAKRINDLEEYQKEALQAFLYNSYSLEDAITEVENNNFIIHYDCTEMSDIAYELIDEGIYGNIPDNLINYIDYDAIGRDLEIEGNYYFINNNCVELTV